MVFVKGQSLNNTIRNCHIHTATTTSYSDDINLIRTYAEDVANCNNDNLTIEGCLLEGGYIGAAVGGTTNVSLPREKGAVIKGNTFAKVRRASTSVVRTMSVLLEIPFSTTEA